MSPQPPAIGFACLWDSVPERTWSYTPWNLRAGMARAGDIVDVGVQMPPLSRRLLKALHLRRHAGHLTTNWAYSRLTDAYSGRILRRGLAGGNAGTGGCDAVLTIGDLAILPVPFFTYQDLSYDALIAASAGVGELAALLSISPATVRRRRERQLAIYAQASGIIAMSQWFARTLVDQTGVPAEKVHVVHPGVSSGQALGPARQAAGAEPPGPALSERPPPRRRLLFVGYDFHRKGGDLVVAALTRLRRELDPQLTLTVAGPKAWPLAGAVPDGVRFLGALPPGEVADLYDDHDLFVMPSRMEPFGIVFAEAISRGLPCIARDAFAMPEIVRPGETGALVGSDDVPELAAAIATALTSDELYATCAARAAQAAAYFSWERAGREVVDVISGALRHLPATLRA